MKFSRSALMSLPIWGALLFSACSADPTPTPTPTPPPEPQTFNVLVGEEDLSESVTFLDFFPSDITLNVDDTVAFTHNTAEPHTITFNVPDPKPEDFVPHEDGRLEANPEIFFPNPPAPPAEPGANVNLNVEFDGTGYLNSGFLAAEGDRMNVTFTKTGTFSYICLLHPSMKGTVTVNAKGTAYPTTQAEYATAAQTAVANYASAAAQTLTNIDVPAKAGSTHTVFAGVSDVEGQLDFLRFVGGENLTIKAGETVKFDMSGNAPGIPHTVSFLGGAEAPPLIVPEIQEAGPPKLFLNPDVLMPAPLPPSPTYDGTGLVNSGLLITSGPTPQDFSLTFTEPGTYKYLCILHDPAGMNGVITVVP